MIIYNLLTIIFLSLIAFVLLAILLVFIYKVRKDRKKDAILSHRELWLYYMNEPELAGILSNNNGTGDCKIDANKMSEKQYRFLVLFLNHMETMVPSYKRFEKGWVDLFKNNCLRRVYEDTKSYRHKKFVKLIDGIISGYDKH